MQFLTSKVISTLFFLLSLGLFLASPTEAAGPPLGDNGIVIKAAVCPVLGYDASFLYDAVQTGAKHLQNLMRYKPRLAFFARYEPAEGDILPYQPPYYRQFIRPTHTTRMSPEGNDYIIFTEQGKLVDVVHQDLTTRKPTYSKCHLELHDA